MGLAGSVDTVIASVDPAYLLGELLVAAAAGRGRSVVSGVVGARRHRRVRLGEDVADDRLDAEQVLVPVDRGDLHRSGRSSSESRQVTCSVLIEALVVGTVA
ncbi:hypothetical protein, partial [Streptomyces violascens]|uniref:hypothetical protein n=1 Tax=Streptomyces violascens TaxID=67381 RepID=UPI0036C0B901